MTRFKKMLLDSARNEAERYFDPKKRLCLIPRETAWYAITLLESHDPQDHILANDILASLEAKDGTHTPCTLYLILKRYADKLGKKSRENIVDTLRDNLSISASVRYTDGNVNHPVAAYVNLLCSGELMGDRVSVNLGRENLYHLKSSAIRRHYQYKQSDLSEYNSPTYTALTIWFLALAAEFVTDKQAKELARFLEERTWLAVAMHWHEPTQQFAGPFSRAYAEDSYGGYSALHCTLAAAVSRNIFIDFNLPLRFIHPSALIQNAFIAVLRFHVPKQAVQVAFEKPFPYHFNMTTYCEQYHENRFKTLNQKKVHVFDDEVYAGGWGELTTYLHHEYCIATAGRPYVNGAQCDSFSVRYRCSDSVSSLCDFRSIYSRMVFNQAKTGVKYSCHTTGSDIGPDYVYEEGRPFTFQTSDKAIVLYSPKRIGHENVENLRLDIIFSYQRPFGEMRIGGRPVTHYPVIQGKREWIIIRDHRVYLAVYPLNVAVNGVEHNVILHQEDDHFIFSLYNYQGKARNFSRHDMSLIRNGFVFLIMDNTMVDSIVDFHSFLQSFDIHDQSHRDGRRQIEMRGPKDKLVFVVDALGERIIEKTRNGQDCKVYHMTVNCATADETYCPGTIYDL